MTAEPALADPVPGDLPAIDDMVGCVARTIMWMQHAYDQQIRVRAADATWAARELETLTAVLHMLEDLRCSARTTPRLSFVPSRRRLKS